MIFNCFLKFHKKYHDSTVFMLRKANGDGYMAIYYKMSSEIKVYKVLGGKISMKSNLDCSSGRKQLVQPTGLLSLYFGKRCLCFKSCRGYFTIEILTDDQPFETDLSDFTPIDKLNLCNLKQLYPKLKVENLFYHSVFAGITEVIQDKTSYHAITDLNLSNNNLSVFPKEICNLKNLQYLRLQDNQIMKLDEELFRLQSEWVNSLKYLNLANNQITKLPFSLFNLKNLEGLLLNHNNLEYLPDAVGRLVKLKSFNIIGNRLTCLPASILKLPIRKGQISMNPSFQNHNQFISMNFTQSNFPSLYHMCLNVVHRETNQKIPPLLESFARLNERETCLCGNKIFIASQKAIIQVFRSNFTPSLFPVEVVSCSKRCYKQHEFDLMEQSYLDPGRAPLDFLIRLRIYRMKEAGRRIKMMSKK